MLEKADFLDIFGAELSPIGYRQVRRGIYQKKGVGFLYQINLGFVGKVAILCNVSFGFLIESVETIAGQHATIQQQRAAGSKHLPTIFAALDVISNFADTQGQPSINLECELAPQIQTVKQTIEAIEFRVRSLIDIAHLATSIKNLPLGHHAFRIPILLKIIDDKDEYTHYINYVKSKNFVPNYDSFLHDVEKQL